MTPRTLRCALQRVGRNRGRRSPGVDGVTMARLVQNVGPERFVQQLREALKLRQYRPSPVRRVLIPKPGVPGKYRPLGIPTIADRVVQAAVKSILEPIFEADFFPVSYGFRPGRGVHGALEHLRMLLRASAAARTSSPPTPSRCFTRALPAASATSTVSRPSPLRMAACRKCKTLERDLVARVPQSEAERS